MMNSEGTILNFVDYITRWLCLNVDLHTIHGTGTGKDSQSYICGIRCSVIRDTRTISVP
jgi:hypothetical protein